MNNPENTIYHSAADVNAQIHEQLEKIVEAFNNSLIGASVGKQNIIHLAVHSIYSDLDAVLEALKTGGTVKIIAVPLDLSEEVEELQKENEQLKREVEILEKLNNKEIGLKFEETPSFWQNFQNQLQKPKKHSLGSLKLRLGFNPRDRSAPKIGIFPSETKGDSTLEEGADCCGCMGEIS